VKYPSIVKIIIKIIANIGREKNLFSKTTVDSHLGFEFVLFLKLYLEITSYTKKQRPHVLIKSCRAA